MNKGSGTWTELDLFGLKDYLWGAGGTLDMVGIRQGQAAPPFTIFDDYRYSQRIAVVVRWFLLAIWLVLLNYRIEYSALTLGFLNAMGVALAALNGYVHWRIWKGRPITRSYVLALSVMDLAIITAGIGATSRFDNTFFVFYYPALLGLALVFPSRRLSFSAVTLVATAYVTLSITLEPGVSYATSEEKVLIVRIATMFAVVAAGNLLTRIEITRRREGRWPPSGRGQRKTWS